MIFLKIKLKNYLKKNQILLQNLKNLIKKRKILNIKNNTLLNLVTDYMNEDFNKYCVGLYPDHNERIINIEKMNEEIKDVKKEDINKLFKKLGINCEIKE